MSPYGKELYQGRKETIERSFAKSKELYGLRYARMRRELVTNNKIEITQIDNPASAVKLAGLFNGLTGGTRMSTPGPIPANL